jgi:hypothetical protein
VLGEHGFVGLSLFLGLMLMTWRTAARVRRAAAADPAQKWLADLVAMIQVSLIGYAVGGAFLGLAYFDLFYHLIALVIIASRLQAQLASGTGVIAPAGLPQAASRAAPAGDLSATPPRRLAPPPGSAQGRPASALIAGGKQ